MLIEQHGACWLNSMVLGGWVLNCCRHTSICSSLPCKHIYDQHASLPPLNCETKGDKRRQQWRQNVLDLSGTPINCTMGSPVTLLFGSNVTVGTFYGAIIAKHRCQAGRTLSQQVLHQPWLYLSSDLHWRVGWKDVTNYDQDQWFLTCFNYTTN